jgi:tRNA/tmRNA/rRNA uracil-C5-methylase (TrmA/RlmC/RlmD family)
LKRKYQLFYSNFNNYVKKLKKNNNKHSTTNHANLLNYYCRNLKFGLVTKTNACKVAGQEGSPEVTFHALGNVRKCEGMNPHTPKGTPTLGFSESDHRGQNPLDRGVPYVIERSWNVDV